MFKKETLSSLPENRGKIKIYLSLIAKETFEMGSDFFNKRNPNTQL